MYKVCLYCKNIYSSTGKDYCSRICMFSSPHYGKKISEANKGKKRTKEQCIKISQVLKGNKNCLGYKYTLQQKQKRSQDLKNRKRSKKELERIRKLGKSSKGTKRNFSTQHRKNLAKAFRGEKSHLWKGGISEPNEKIRQSVMFKLWREGIFRRDNYICQKCKERGGYLHPHHIFNFAKYPELRFKLKNGITFCRKCHMKFHAKYGREHNTQSQLQEFCNKGMICVNDCLERKLND